MAFRCFAAISPRAKIVKIVKAGRRATAPLQRMLAALDLAADLVASQALEHAEEAVGRRGHLGFVLPAEKLVILVASLVLPA
jgi:hypothetical protein